MAGITGLRRVLIVEDDRTLARLLAGHLESLGYRATIVYTWKDVDAAVRATDPSLVLLDDRLPDARGLKEMGTFLGEFPVIVITAFATPHHAVTAMRLGAAEYIAKPINPAELELAIERALAQAKERTALAYLRTRLDGSRADGPLVGESAACRRLLREIERAAEKSGPVLIRGEPGTDKRQVAREVHRRSARSGGLFVPVGIAEDPGEPLEAILFGHEAGALAGADRRRRGLVELAEGGTLYFDEVAALTAEQQAALLELLESARFRRLGGCVALLADVRIVAATRTDLHACARSGRFDRELLRRLGSIDITVPPLRERPEDILPNASRVLARLAGPSGAPKRLSAAAEQACSRYPWPGNFRELRAVLERAVLLAGEEPVLAPAHLGLAHPSIGPGEHGVQLAFDHEPTLEEMRKAYLECLLARYQGHRGRVAQVLGLSERSVYRLLDSCRADDRDPSGEGRSSCELALDRREP